MAESNQGQLHSELDSLRIDESRRQRRRRPPSSRRWIGLGIAALLLLGLLWWRTSGPEMVDVDIARVVSPADSVALPGLSGSGYIVTGDRYVSIGVRVPGRIEQYFVEEGESVTRGDALVQLDDRDYRATLRRAEASLQIGRADLALARSELRRGESLRGEKVISDQELDVLRNRAAVAEATLERTEAELDQARVNLEYTVLRAPSDGVVLAKLKEVGEIAVPGGFAGSGDLVRMANLSDMRAEVDVNEADLGRVRLGGAATVTPDAYPEARYDARVVKLYPQVNRQKGTLRVEVKIEDPDQRLLPDMSARITFLASAPGKKPDGPPQVSIADGAIRVEEGEAFVWSVEDGRARRIAVEVIARTGGRTRVSGLSGGEAVVVGLAELDEGRSVSVRQP
jgi:HlyD family secretion protein